MRTRASVTVVGHRFAMVVLGVCVSSLARGGTVELQGSVGVTGVIVQSQFGGQIFGFDIDQASNEGILCEAQTLENGRTHAAIETFDQTTGAIIRA
jgi:hypothetical protein